MSAQTLGFEASPAKRFDGVDCRVWERHLCGLQTTCQPVAARGDSDLAWSAQIRDLSVGGLGMVLKRRFERGTGLAIEIPETATAPADTLLVRVIHVTAMPDGLWLLGCSFVSQLSDDELQTLLRLAQTLDERDQEPQAETLEPQAIAGPGTSFLIQGVTWEGFVAGDKVGSQLVRRLHLAGSWPLAEGTVLRIWFGHQSESKIRVRVTSCDQRGGHWFVKYTFMDSPSPEWLRSFGSK